MLLKLIHAFVSIPWVYDYAQRIAGIQQSHAQLRPFLSITHQTVLDIGGGTGMFAPFIPPSNEYICVDNDPQKVAGFQKKFPAHQAILADALNMPFTDKRADYSMCINVTHHLTDEQLPHLFREIARVTKRRLIFHDALKQDGIGISQFLWALDRGSFPRSLEQLYQAITEYFTIEHIKEYKVYHRYLICSCQPKDKS